MQHCFPRQGHGVEATPPPPSPRQTPPKKTSPAKGASRNQHQPRSLSIGPDLGLQRSPSKQPRKPRRGKLGPGGASRIRFPPRIGAALQEEGGASKSAPLAGSKQKLQGALQERVVGGNVARPDWDFTTSDMDRYKLSAAEQLRRQLLRISRHHDEAADEVQKKLKDMQENLAPFLHVGEMPKANPTQADALVPASSSSIGSVDASMVSQRRHSNAHSSGASSSSGRTRLSHMTPCFASRVETGRIPGERKPDEDERAQRQRSAARAAAPASSEETAVLSPRLYRRPREGSSSNIRSSCDFVRDEAVEAEIAGFFKRSGEKMGAGKPEQRLIQPVQLASRGAQMQLQPPLAQQPVLKQPLQPPSQRLQQHDQCHELSPASAPKDSYRPFDLKLPMEEDLETMEVLPHDMTVWCGFDTFGEGTSTLTSAKPVIAPFNGGDAFNGADAWRRSAAELRSRKEVGSDSESSNDDIHAKAANLARQLLWWRKQGIVSTYALAPPITEIVDGQDVISCNGSNQELVGQSEWLDVQAEPVTEADLEEVGADAQITEEMPRECWDNGTRSAAATADLADGD